MAAELQYRAMDVGYAVSYPHFTQKSEEEGPRVLGVVLGMRAVAPPWELTLVICCHCLYHHDSFNFQELQIQSDTPVFV